MNLPEVGEVPQPLGGTCGGTEWAAGKECHWGVWPGTAACQAWSDTVVVEVQSDKGMWPDTCTEEAGLGTNQEAGLGMNQEAGLGTNQEAGRSMKCQEAGPGMKHLDAWTYMALVVAGMEYQEWDLVVAGMDFQEWDPDNMVAEGADKGPASWQAGSRAVVAVHWAWPGRMVGEHWVWPDMVAVEMLHLWVEPQHPRCTCSFMVEGVMGRTMGRGDGEG